MKTLNEEKGKEIEWENNVKEEKLKWRQKRKEIKITAGKIMK